MKLSTIAKQVLELDQTIPKKTPEYWSQYHKLWREEAKRIASDFRDGGEK